MKKQTLFALAGLGLMSCARQLASSSSVSESPAEQHPGPRQRGAETVPDMRLPTTGCGKSPAMEVGTSSEKSLISEGRQRLYRLHVPKSYAASKPIPLIFSFHGRGGSAKRQEELTEMSQLDAIVVYPQGLLGAEGKSAWQGAPYAAGANDVLFVSHLMDTMQTDFCVDETRIYASGKSNGGGFTALLGCQLSHRLAAIAPVSAAFYPEAEVCRPSRPVPTLEFQGTADKTTPYAGSSSKNLPSIMTWLKKRAKLNACQDSYRVETDTPVKGVTRLSWQECEQVLIHYKIENMGHDWPSTRPNADSEKPTVMDATPVIWKFFQEHSLE